MPVFGVVINPFAVVGVRLLSPKQVFLKPLPFDENQFLACGSR
jgi:hypothetical protein